MPKKNLVLLRRLRMRFLRMKHPEHFDIETVAKATDCGAAMCFIGHTLDLAGYKMRLLDAGERDGMFDYDFLAPSGRKVREPKTTARELLGLDRQEAIYLFLDYSIKTPKQAAKRIEALISDNEPDAYGD